MSDSIKITDLTTLSPALFWDVDITKLSAEKHWRYIITRVVERGNFADIKFIWHLYGALRIKRALIQARSLSRENIIFFANIFGIKADEFRSYSAFKSDKAWDR